MGTTLKVIGDSGSGCGKLRFDGLREMNSRHKEISEGGLAVSLVLC